MTMDTHPMRPAVLTHNKEFFGLLRLGQRHNVPAFYYALFRGHSLWLFIC